MGSPKARKMPAEERRKELIDAARKVFMEKGYVATTVADITREAGSSHGTFYVYFNGIEEIFDAVAQNYVTQVYEAKARIVETPGIPALEKIMEILLKSDEPESTEWWIQEFNQPHLLHLGARITQKSIEMFVPLLTRVIQDAVEEGSIDVPFPEATAAFLVSAGVIQRKGMNTIESLTDEDWTRAYQDMARRLLGLEA